MSQKYTESSALEQSVVLGFLSLHQRERQGYSEWKEFMHKLMKDEVEVENCDESCVKDCVKEDRKENEDSHDEEKKEDDDDEEEKKEDDDDDLSVILREDRHRNRRTRRHRRPSHFERSIKCFYDTCKCTLAKKQDKETTTPAEETSTEAAPSNDVTTEVPIDNSPEVS
jgi:hypothetical protein